MIFGFIPIFENDGVVSLFRLKDHVDRLFTSCATAGVPLDYSSEEIQLAIKDTVRENPGSKYAKISVYISSIEIDVVPQEHFSTVAIAAYEPQEDIISKNTQPFHTSKELSVWLEKEKHQRRHDIIPPQVKIAGNYTSSMMAKWKARKNGYDEIILTDEEGYITEAPTSNVFIVNNDNVLLTAPEEEVLYGITRKSILEITEDENIETKVERIPIDVLENAKENKIKHFIFASTSSVYGYQKKFPNKEEYETDKPLSLYAATKKSDELISYSYSHLYGINQVGLGFLQSMVLGVGQIWHYFCLLGLF